MKSPEFINAQSHMLVSMLYDKLKYCMEIQARTRVEKIQA